MPRLFDNHAVGVLKDHLVAEAKRLHQENLNTIANIHAASLQPASPDVVQAQS